MDEKTLLARTRSFCRRKAKKLKKDNGSKKVKLAQALYGNIGISYGFDESLKTGNYGPFPHEIKKTAECVNYAAYVYFLADALGLKPRLFWCYKLKHPKENAHEAFGSFDHAFIDVDVGAKRRVVIDPLLQMYGPVSYDLFKRTMSVVDNPNTNNTKREFERLEELKLSDIVERLMFHRTPEGEMKLLEQGQAISTKYTSWMIHYSPDKRTLESRMIRTDPFVMKRVMKQRFHYDESGEIDSGSLELGVCSKVGWLELSDYVSFGEFDIAPVNALFDAVEEVVETVYKSPNWKGRFKPSKLRKLLSSYGIQGFKAERLPESVDRQKVSDALSAFEKLAEEQFKVIVNQQNKELFISNLACNALYSAELEKRKKQGADNDNFIFPRKKLNSLAAKAIRNLYALVAVHHNKARDEALSWLDKTKFFNSRVSIHHSSHNVNVETDDVFRQLNHVLYDRERYYGIADFIIYSEKFLKGKKADELVRMVEEKGLSLLEEYKRILMHRIADACIYRSFLKDRYFLPRVSRKIKGYVEQR